MNHKCRRRSTTAHRSAPKGRQSIAQGVSPGNPRENDFASPEGATEIHEPPGQHGSAAPSGLPISRMGGGPRAYALGYYLSPRWGSSRAIAILLSVATTVISALPSAAGAERKEALPAELRDVGVTEHLEAQVPLDLEFVDSGGKEVTLGDLFDGERPIVLTMNYSNCPMLCSLQLNGLFDALELMKWDIGNQFDMITVTIDPLETTGRAEMTKLKYLKRYRRAGAAEGYHCLTGRDEDIKRLAEVVGFRYKYEPTTRQYIHAAVTMILTPDGRVSRYLYGVQYDPQTLRFSLLEAAEGKVGTTMDQILLFCFHYDAAKGRYGPSAFRLMQFGGGLTVLVLGGVILALRRRERGKKVPKPELGSQGETPRGEHQGEER